MADNPDSKHIHEVSINTLLFRNNSSPIIRIFLWFTCSIHILKRILWKLTARGIAGSDLLCAYPHINHTVVHGYYAHLNSLVNIEIQYMWYVTLLPTCWRGEHLLHWYVTVGQTVKHIVWLIGKSKNWFAVVCLYIILKCWNSSYLGRER